MTDDSAKKPRATDVLEGAIHDGAVVQVHIAGIDDEGRGRAVVETGKGPIDVAVRGALPGDVVLAKVERVFAARGLAQARALDVLEDGGLSVERVCPHASPCPGCPLHDVEPSFVVALKRERLCTALADVGRADLIDRVEDVVVPESPWERRQKVKLTAGGRKGSLKLGLYVPHLHVLVDASACPHVDGDVEDAVALVREVMDNHALSPAIHAHPGEPVGLKAVIARAFVEGTGVVLVTGSPLPDALWGELCRLFDDGLLASIAERVDDSSGNSLVGGELRRKRGPLQLTPKGSGEKVSVDAFCQPDPGLARAMVDLVARALVDDAGAEGSAEAGVYLDLYAGAGAFAQGLRRRGAVRVVAVERALASSQTLRATGVDVVAGSVEEALPTLTALAQPAPLLGIVADPPEKGLASVGPAVAALPARRFALVSCDPDAMAKDLVVLTAAGWHLDRIVPFDLFSGGPGIEAVSLLSRPG